MAAALTHAQSSVKKWGGVVEDYLPVHLHFDETKHHLGDFRHRALRHHTLGIAECLKVFGEALTLSTGRVIPTRWVAEQHVTEDCGFLPTVADWFRAIRPTPWMCRSRKLSQELEGAAGASKDAPAAAGSPV
jgi:hypothetical protein